MKLIIDIPEAEYEDIKYFGTIVDESRDYIASSILNGTPLPKGHGRLIDADAIKPKFCNSNIYNKYGEKGFWYYSVKDMNDTPTIIEADVPKRRKGTPLEENDGGYNCENWIP